MENLCPVCAEYTEVADKLACLRAGASGFGPLITDIEETLGGVIDPEDRNSAKEAMQLVDIEKLRLLRGLAELTINGMKGRVIMRNGVEVADRSLPACEDPMILMIAELVLDQI